MLDVGVNSLVLKSKTNPEKMRSLGFIYLQVFPLSFLTGIIKKKIATLPSNLPNKTTAESVCIVLLTKLATKNIL